MLDGKLKWSSGSATADTNLYRASADTLKTDDNFVIEGNLTVNGTTTTVNSTVLTVDDKNIELASSGSPSDVAADGGGITLRGTTDKTFNWIDSTDSWTSSENLDVASGKTYKINGTNVLSSNTLGSGIIYSSLTTLGTVSSLQATSPNFTGTAVFSGGNFGLDINGNVEISGRLDINEVRETVNDSAVSSNVFTCDYSGGGLFYGTGSLTANFTVNITNAPTDNGKAMTVSLFVTQGATGYIPTTLNINGSSATIKWVGGSAPTPTSSNGKIDIFNFTLIRRSSTWTVLANANLNY